MAPHGPLDDFSEFPQGPNPLVATEAAPKSFYLSLFALVLPTLRFEKMSWGSADGRLELSDVDNLARQIRKKGFRTVDLLSAFV